jgi:hypothetical protein
MVLGVSGLASATQKPSANAILITFKDGHQQAFSLSEIERIEFSSSRAVHTAPVVKPSTSNSTSNLELPGRRRFVGEWTVGEGNGRNFHITLDENGQARKSIGTEHGTWVYVDDEARVTWDDGARDAIRKVGTKYEKFAYRQGASFDGAPYNVTDARNTDPEPI